MNDLFARVEDQEAAGAVGVFGFAGLECSLPEGCRLLVSEDAGDRRFAEQLGGVDVPIYLGGGLDGRHHGGRDAEDVQDLLVPLKRFEVHEQGSGSVGDVGDVHTAVNTAGQVPENPGIGVAEQQVAGFGTFAGAIHVVQDPFDLGSREVRGQRQADLLFKALHSPPSWASSSTMGWVRVSCQTMAL